MTPSINKRRSPRQMCSDFVKVSFADQEGRTVSDTGLLEDVSQQGLNISLNIPLPEGQDIKVQTEGFSGKARVRYCNCAGSAGTGERALRVSVDAALRAGIFKASGSFDPMGFWDVRGR